VRDEQGDRHDRDAERGDRDEGQRAGRGVAEDQRGGEAQEQLDDGHGPFRLSPRAAPGEVAGQGRIVP